MNWTAVAAAVPSVCGFTNDLAAHLEPGGYVISCPAFFISFRAVPRSAPMEQLLNPWWRWPDEQCDCWFIWLAAGDVCAAAHMIAREFGSKKWVAFQREGPAKFWRFESSLQWLKAKAAAQTAKQSISSARA